jgi:hypothetical protein
MLQQAALQADHAMLLLLLLLLLRLLLLLLLQVASKGYHILQPMLAPHAERALRSADQLLKDRLGFDAGLSSASSKFWA